MPPSYVFAQVYAEFPLGRVAHSALPGAPVRPFVPRGRRVRALSSAVRSKLSAAAPRVDPTPESNTPHS